MVMAIMIMMLMLMVMMMNLPAVVVLVAEQLLAAWLELVAGLDSLNL